MPLPYPSYTLAEATHKLEGYCTYQERCHKEVRQKLREMHMNPDLIDRVMAHLIQNNYLNEERFAKSYVRGKFNIKKWGRNRIISGLKQREISKFNIQAALKEIDDESYSKTFDALAKKRLAAIKEAHPQKKRKKLADYLLYRGWESHMVYEKIREIIP